MKKWLSFISTLTLSSIAISPIVACGNQTSTPNSSPTPKPLEPKGLPINEDKLDWKFVSNPNIIQLGDNKVYLFIYKDHKGNYDNLYLTKSENLQSEIRDYDPEIEWFYSWNGDGTPAGALVNSDTGEIENWEIVNYPISILPNNNKLYLLIYNNRGVYNTVRIKNNSDVFPSTNRTNQEVLQIMIKRPQDIKHVYCWSNNIISREEASYPTPQINSDTGEIIY